MSLSLAVALALAAPSQVASSTSTPQPIHHSLRVIIIPTRIGPPLRNRAPIPENVVRGFSEEFEDAATSLFAWRNWELVKKATVTDLIGSFKARCRDATCYDHLARHTGATHWIASSLFQTRMGNCIARVMLHDLLKDERAGFIQENIVPCSVDNVLTVASDIGRRISEGPRAPVKVTLSLTDLAIPAVDIPDIDDVTVFKTATSTKTRRGFDLHRALEIYRDKHMIVFDSEPPRGRYYVIRGEKKEPLSECGVRRFASAPLPPEIVEFCDGNDWEWFWLGVPTGGLIAYAAYGDLEDGAQSNVLGFVFGTGVAIISAGLALFLNVDAKDPIDSEYYSSRTEIEAVVAKSNKELRRVLDLTKAEVEVAGMRP